MITKSTISVLFISLICLINSCHTITEKSINKTNKLLSNGKHLLVEKMNEETTSIGMITKHNYGTSHQFTYRLSVDHGDINWDGGSGEPKHILFCQDSVYLHYLKEKSVRIEYTDSTNQTIKHNYQYEIHEVFERYVDERYFFKLFGEAYWVEASPENYARRKKFCHEFEVPNDNELSLNTSVLN